jgi:hypothetical protein
MIFLDYLYNLPNDTSGIDQVAIDTISITPAIIPMILFFIFLVVFVGGATRQKIRTGTADYASWAVIASIATLLPALLFSFNAGFIRLDWLIIVVSLNILSGIWLFMDRKTSEV